MLSKAERDALIEQHTEYARALALHCSKNIPRFVSREDLKAAGVAGLVEAAQRFDPTRGAQFATFAYYRVRGAVFDYLHKLTNADPHIRARAASDAAIDDAVQSALGDRPRDAKSTPADAADALAAVLDAAAVSFTVAECAESLLSQQPRGTDAEVETQRREEAAIVRAAVDALPDKERTMMRAVYFESMTIEDAGKRLGLSKSWASRLHARALTLLRESMGSPPGE